MNKMNAFILVDLQNDFLPGGSLPVNNGHAIIPLVNQLLDRSFDIKLATKDWHPNDHGSFAIHHGKQPGEKTMLAGIEQILWPVHCVQDSFGSKFPPELRSENINKIFFKGTDKQIDSYSAFFDNQHLKSTGLGEFLKQKNVKKVFIAGLATDYCVLYTVLDARKLGFDTYVISDACKGIDLHPEDSQNAFYAMQNAGAHVITLDELMNQDLLPKA